MSVIETLTTLVVADINPLRDGFSAAIGEAQGFAREMGSIRVSPAVGDSSSFSGVGDEIRSALLAGLAPLQGFGATMVRQVDQIGGTFTTLAKRIDISMKEASGFTERQLGRMKLGFKALAVAGFAGAVHIASGFAAPLFSPAIAGAAALGLAFPKVADLANRAASQISGYFTKVGSVTKKTLSEDGGGKAAKGVGAIGLAAGEARKGVGALKMELGQTLGLVTGFGAAGGIIAFFSGGIRGATGLAESVNKVDVAFGDAGARVKAQTDAMARDFGTPKGQILDAATGIGLIGQASGLAQPKAADFANSLTKLALDAKSFHHVGLDDALQKIRSGLAGQSEPLREWGVLLTEDAVANEAVRLGLAASSEAVSEGAKVQARASLITKGLGYVTGDMAATAGSTANMFDALRGRVGNLATSLGNSLLPAVDVVLRGFTDAVGKISAWASANESTLAGFGQYVADVFRTVGAGLTNFISGFASIGAEIASILGLTSDHADGFGKAIGEAFSFVGFAWRNIGSIAKLVWIGWKEGFINAGEWIGVFGANLKMLGGYIANNWRQLIVDGVTSVGTVFKNLATNIYNLGKAVIDFLKNPKGGLNFNWTPLLDGFEATAAELPALIKPHLTSLKDESDAVLEEIGKNELAFINSRKEGGKAPAARAKFAPQLDAFGADEKGKGKADRGPQFAGAFQMASVEAYSAIVKASGMGGADGPAKIVKAQQDGNAQLRLINAGLGGVKGAIDGLAQAIGKPITI